MPTPPAAALAAILSGQSHVTRRCEIYESDGITPWIPSFTPRMVTGKISVDYTRDERRNIDVTLDNSDGLINHDPNGGLWYDKIIKIFRGIEYVNTRLQPAIAVIDANATLVMPVYLSQLGFTNITIFPSTVTVSQLLDFDVVAIAADTVDFTTGIATLLAQAYTAGLNILTVSPYSTATTVPLIGGSATVGTQTDPDRYTITASVNDMPFWRYLPFQVYNHTHTYTIPNALAANTFSAGTSVLNTNSTNYSGYGVLYQTGSNGNRWVHYHAPITDYQPGGTDNVTYAAWHYSRDQLLFSVVQWLYDFTSELDWEVQVGEYLIDSIKTPRAPRTIEIVGRDYTKQLKESFFDNPTAFGPGLLVDDLIQDIAENAGITKFRLNSQGAVTSSTLTFDASSDRWTAIAGITEGANVEPFFDYQGYLVTRPFFDPTTSPISFFLKTGNPDGNLVDWTETSDDSELYNRVVVNGTSDDATITGNIYQGIAENHEPSSPTSIENLGRTITYYYSSPFFTSNDQCIAYAQSLLNVHALESFDLDFNSIVFAWLEAGEILQCDAVGQPGEPNRFLLTTFNIPLTLDPMDGTGKRITIVG